MVLPAPGRASRSGPGRRRPTVLGTETVTHADTLEEKRAWLSIPAFARPPGPFTYEQRMEILERAYARADASRPVSTAWLVVTAEA